MLKFVVELSFGLLNRLDLCNDYLIFFSRYKMTVRFPIYKAEDVMTEDYCEVLTWKQKRHLINASKVSDDVDQLQKILTSLRSQRFCHWEIYQTQTRICEIMLRDQRYEDTVEFCEKLATELPEVHSRRYLLLAYLAQL